MTAKNKITTVAIILISLGFFVFSSCDNTQRELQTEVDEFEAWVDETANDFDNTSEESWEEVEASWNEVENEYNETINELDGRSSEMRQQTREEYLEAKKEFRRMKDDISREINSREAIAGVEDALMVSSADDDLDKVTDENIVEVYRSFVNAVDEFKDRLSARDWNKVETYWDMLNNRKNEVEDKISGDENAEIAELKLEYAGYKTVYKTGAKLESKEENME